MNELKYQAALIKEAKLIGGHGWKMANAFLAGIPDICIILPGYFACFIECKVVKQLPATGRILIKTTTLQKVTIEKIQRAGGVAGIILLVDNNWPQYQYCTYNTATTHFIHGEDKCLERKRGQPWRIKSLVHSIHSHRESIINAAKSGEKPMGNGSNNQKSKPTLN